MENTLIEKFKQALRQTMAHEPKKHDHESLREVFESLSDTERNILQLISILFIATDHYDLATHLQNSGVQDSKGKIIYPKNLDPIISKLKAIGLVESYGRSGYRCVEMISTHVIRSAQKNGRLALMAKVVREKKPAIPSYFANSNRLEDLRLGLREIRIGIHSQDWDNVDKFVKLCYEQHSIETLMKPPMVSICGSPFDPEWFGDLPASLQAMALWEIVLHEISDFENISNLQEFIQNSRILDYQDYDGALFRKCLVAIHIFNAEFKKARDILASSTGVADSVKMLGWLHFLCGENELAITCFSEALASLRRVRKKRKAFFTDISGLFYLLALLKTGDQNSHMLISQFLGELEKLRIHFV